MRKILVALLGTGLLVSPAHAADWRDQAAGVHSGVFVGAKLRLSMGGSQSARPRAALAIAPAHSRISGEGVVSTRIGEGLALNFGRRSKPTLTLAGIRADRALGLQRKGGLNTDNRLGMSDGGKVALGLGIAAVVAGGLYLAADHIADCDEGECD